MHTKRKISYSCENCNYTSLKWLGCCPECKEWNTLTEVLPPAPRPYAQNSGTAHSTLELHSYAEVAHNPQSRIKTNIEEWDRVLGGGILPSSLLILTGDPGIGKSTLLLQVCNELAKQQQVFYFSTEESLHQITQRAQRIKCTEKQLLFSDHADLTAIVATAEQKKPAIIIIDSIQNCYIPGSHSFPGSIGQLREATFHLLRLSKEHGITVIITGHITKEGVIAGPKTLEHMVDGVFYLQGEDRFHTRILRAVKNRFGTINEIGFFEMGEQGLQEVTNINAHLLEDSTNQAGSAIISTIEGSRPLLLELQALTIESKLGFPQRVISGVDHKQVMLIAAILEKYLHVKLSTHDIYFKVSGGFKVKGSTIDLGIALALLSSYFQQPIPAQSMVLGEISLTGQIKPINQINLFAREAAKFNIQKLFVAKNQKMEKFSCDSSRFGHVYELLTLFPS